MYWLCFKTNTRKEFEAKQALNSLGFNVLLPYYLKTIKHARKCIQTRYPIFPSYGFLFYNGDVSSLYKIKYTRGIKYYLHQPCGNPNKVPNKIIDYIQSLQQKDGSYALDINRFKKGDNVNILDGALSGMKAVFHEKVDEFRAKLFVNFLGRVNKVDLQYNMIERY